MYNSSSRLVLNRWQNFLHQIVCTSSLINFYSKQSEIKSSNYFQLFFSSLQKQHYFFCDCVWMRGHIDVMRMSHWVTNAVWYTRGHMNLSVIIGQFVNSNGTHSSNITFCCLTEKRAIFNEMSPTQNDFHNLILSFKNTIQNILKRRKF